MTWTFLREYSATIVIYISTCSLNWEKPGKAARHAQFVNDL